MPSAAEVNRKKFTETFNRVLGDKMGKPIKFYSDAQMASSVPQATTNRVAASQAKTPKSSSHSLSQIKTTVAPVATDAGSLLGNAAPTVDSNKAALIAQVQANLSKIVPQQKNTGGGISASGLINPVGWFRSAKDLIGKGAEYVGITDKENPSGTIGATASGAVNAINQSTPAQDAAGGIKRVLDVVERPAYAINEGSRQVAEGINNGNGWSLPRDFVIGAWHGLGGYKKTGFGQVVETSAPNLPLNVKRALGAIGDVGLDPITYTSVGTDIVAKNATNAGLRAGLDATGKDAIKHEVGKIVDDVLSKTGALDDLKTVKGGFSVDQKAITDSIISEVKDKLDTIAYDTKEGQVIGGGARDAHGTLSQTTAEVVRDKYISIIEKPKQKFLSALESGKKFTPAEFSNMRKNKLFSDWLDGANEAIKEASAQGRPIKAADVAEQADIKYAAKLSPKVNEIHGKVLAQLDDTVMRIPRINFLNQEIYLPRMGKALNAVKKSAGNRFENLNKAFNYASWMPGYTSHISQKMRSINMRTFDDFKSAVEEAYRGTTSLDRKEIKYATEHGVTLTGKRGEVQAFEQQAYRDMFNQEAAQGVRDTSKTPYAPDYVFNRITKGSNNIDFEKDWRLPKKASIRDSKGSTVGFRSEDAVAKGMKVENDSAASLVYRKMRSINKLSKTYLEKDLLTHYGIASSIPIGEAKARNLIEVSLDRQPWLKDVLKPGQKAYLDKDIYKVMDNYRQLTSFKQTKEANDLVKSIEKVTQVFKTANTIYWPGFHIRNAISDIFMGALDGVKSKDYGTISKAMFNKDKAVLKMGEDTVPFRRILESYQNNASSGFIDSELNIRVPKSDLSTTRFMDALHSPSQFNAKLRDMSKVREDFGRLVHYYHAMNDEYTHLISKGVKPEAAWKGAEEAAIFRVNKYKFDYTALTPFEQKIRSYGIPFYTYMRKASPVLVENLFMNPRYFSYINKLQKALAPSEEFSANNLPSWMRDASYSQLSSSDNPEPIGFTDALFPTRTLSDAFRNPVISANPVIQAGFELNSGKDTFTGKPVTGLTDVLKNKWKGTTQISSAVGNKTTLEKWATFTGIPLYKVTAAKQAGRTNELKAQLSAKVQGINNKIEAKGLKLSIRHNQIYLIKPKTPTTKEEVVGVYDTFAELPFKV